MTRMILLLIFSLSAITAGAETSLTIESGKIAKVENSRVLIEFDLTTGLYRGKQKASGTVMFKDADYEIDRGDTSQWKRPAHKFRAEEWSERKGTLVKGRTLRVWYLPQESYDPERFLSITVYDDSPQIEIGWGVRNPFEYEIRVREADVLLNGKLFEDQEPTGEKVLRSGAGAERNFVEEGWEIDALNGAMLTYKDTSAGSARRTLVAGGLKYSEFARRVKLAPLAPGKWKEDPSGAPVMTLTFWDPQGKRIGPGETWTSEDTALIDYTTADPFASLEAYGEALARANDARPNPYDFPTLCGWMTSSGGHGDGTPINHSPGLVDQTIVAREAGLMKYTPLAVRLEPDFYCYSNQGDTQQGWWDDEHWREYGALREPYETFASFCDAVKKQGVIVFTYFQGSLPSNDFARAHPGWMLNNDISLLHIDHAHHRPLIRYDYTDPGFQAHTRAMWNRLRRDGVVGIKFDYPETAWARDGGFEDKSYTTTAAYREMYALCREGLGPEAFIHERIIGNPTHEDVPRLDVAAGIVDLQRVWGDASYFSPEMASRIGLRWFKQGKVFRYYPDGKSFYARGRQPKKPLSQKDRRTFLTLVGLLSGRIELGTGFGKMNAEMLYDLTRLFPILPNGQAFRPVDMLLGKEHPEVYVYDVRPGWKQVILINNDTEVAKEISAPLSGNTADTGALGFATADSCRVFDFWNQTARGVLRGNERLTAKLEPGEALIYSLRKIRPAPMILGTNRHVMSGMFEIADERWDSASKTLQFTAHVIGGEPMIVTVSPPDGGENGRVKNVKADHATTSAERDGEIDRIKIEVDQNMTVPVKVVFE